MLHSISPASRQKINVMKMTLNARIVASCGLRMSTSIPKARRNGANVRVASFGFATLATYLLKSGNAVIRRRKMEDNSDNAEDDNGEE